jgi:hypothetical protein
MANPRFRAQAHVFLVYRALVAAPRLSAKEVAAKTDLPEAEVSRIIRARGWPKQEWLDDDVEAEMEALLREARALEDD